MKIPKKAEWTFDTPEIAASFDEHVREQLPWYDLATSVTAEVGAHYIPQSGMVYDIGASTGNISKHLASIIVERDATIVSLDSSREMAKHFSGVGSLTIADATSFDYQSFDFAVCFLTLMFMGVEERARLLRTLRTLVKRGGAIFVLDKIEGVGGYIGTINSRLTLAAKIESGVSAEDIVNKELSLIGIQRPLNESELAPSCEIFRYGEFSGRILEAK